MGSSNLAKAACLLAISITCSVSLAGNAQIFAVQFSEDGKYLATGGSAGNSLFYDRAFTGGIKIWDAKSGSLVKSFGQLVELNQMFGDNYGRIATRKKGIHSFRDMLFNGSFPDGKIILLPSSLGKMEGVKDMRAPSFIGGYFNLDSGEGQRIQLDHGKVGLQRCAGAKGAYDYIGPIVASHNGRYAVASVNECKPLSANGIYQSSLYVLELATGKVLGNFPNVASGVYALGVADNGKRIAFVGAQQFAVIDVDNGNLHPVADYGDEVFMIPRQFSELFFSKDSTKLISLRYIYDIETGKEQTLPWKNANFDKTKYIKNVKVAPDLSYFVIVKPRKAQLDFTDEGLPISVRGSDQIVLLDPYSGKATELSLPEKSYSKCITDVSPDSSLVAVGCKKGLIRVYSAKTGALVWEQTNKEYKGSPTKKQPLIQALNQH